ncbi:MAG: PL29 family lyase N-terminal domain-containing protein [Bacteroides sp.]|nr:PL29 family lyase N-terminal domain-containing protein [Bacteroides sp.]
MKSNKFIAVALAATLCTAGFTSCGDDYDDTVLKGQIENLDKRVSTLEDQMKSDIAAIQAAIATVEGRDYVKAVKEVAGGYEITFGNGTVATIKNGKDGLNGADGKDGVDGKDGLNGTDGKDGADGKDGIDGANGKDGVNGKDGIDGTNGKDGVNGKDGIDGTNGKDGVNGKDGKDGADGKSVTVKEEGGVFYWYIGDEPLLDDNNQKIPATRTPEFTAELDEVSGKVCWKVDGNWLTDAAGNHIQATGDKGEQGIQGEQGIAGPLNASVSADGLSITFIFSEVEYKVNVAQGALEIIGSDKFIVGEATEYTVALPGTWKAEDLDVVRADVACTGAAGVAITRADAAWEVKAVKEGADGAKITLTGSNIKAGMVAELTVAFVKKASGEKLVGSTFLTAWERDANAKTLEMTNDDGDVAAAIEGYAAECKIYTNINITGSSVAMGTGDWAALAGYEPLRTLTISNSTAGAEMPEGAFKNTALESVDLTGPHLPLFLQVHSKAVHL